MKSAVLLLAHGAPERIEDVEQYLRFVRGGQPVSPRVLEEVTLRYAAIGGSSPLTHWTQVQSAALQKTLDLPVFFGMRNWRPFIQETMTQIRAAGIGKLACICLAPQYSEMSVGLYMKHTREAARELELSWAKSYHDEPLLIDAFAERLGPVSATHPSSDPHPSSEPRPSGSGAFILFTAHSLPAPNEIYDAECRATASAVAACLSLTNWEFAYQSQGMSGGTWLGPTVESCLDRYAAEGLHDLVIAPIGFVCDHVEILYDIDIHFRDYAAALGIRISRPESLNGSPAFTRALAKVATACLA